MAACPRCGEANPDRARFCLACAAPLEPPAGEARKTVTVVFADITGSTRLGEQLDPESHRSVMSRYFEEMRTALERHGGTVEKFIGDAVMAVFGIPLLHEDDALRALRGALEMRSRLEELNPEFRRRFGVELAMRIGVNTGEVIVGDRGAAYSLVTGDAVVVGKRLEETAGAGEIQLGEDTYRLVKEAVRVELLEPVAAKGKAQPLRRYRLLEVLSGAGTLALRFGSPLVGRAAELSALERFFELACSRRTCHLLTILGAAGIGKSRLTHELVERLGGRAAVVHGRCLPYGEGITFWPLVEVMKQAAGLTDRDPPEKARAKIAQLLPDDDDAPLVCERVAAAIGRSDTPVRTEETFWAVRRLLEALARERPLVAVFDDLQWAEERFQDLVEYLAGWSRDFPILVVCLARPDLLDVRPGWNVPRENRKVLLLEPLSEPDSERLIGNLVGDVPLTGAVRERIAASADGNPLFVEELLRMLVDEGLLRREDGAATPTRDLSQLAIPPSIHALLAARLDRLAPNERAVIQRAAVVGQVFWGGAVAELSADPVAGDVGRWLQSLVRKELIRHESSTMVGEDAFRFAHILIRDAAYSALPKERRAALHERLAAWLEGKAAGRTAEYDELVGYHLEQAFRYRRMLGAIDAEGLELGRRAAGRLAEAGRRALARGDSPAASSLLGRALALHEPGEPGRAELLLDLARAVKDTGDLASAEALLDEALSAVEAADDERLAWQVRIDRARLSLHMGKAGPSEALAVAREAVGALERLGDDFDRSRAWSLAADVHYVRGELEEMEHALEHVLLYSRRAGDRAQTTFTLNAMARAALGGPMPVDEAIRRCEKLIEEGGGDLVLTGAITSFLAYLEAMRGRFDAARTLYRRSHAVFEELGRSVQLATVRIYSGAVEMLAGDLAAAERELRLGFDTLEEMGERGNLSSLAALLAEVLHADGRDAEAERYTAISERAASADDVAAQVGWRAARAKVYGRTGKADEGERLAREAVAVASATDYLSLRADALVSLALVLGAAGPTEESRASLTEAVDLYRRKGVETLARGAAALLEQPIPTRAGL